MDRDSHGYLFKAASAALIAATAGCAPIRGPQPNVTDDTRVRLAQALQDSGDTTNAAIVRSQTSQQAGRPVDPLTHATALVTAGQVDEGIKVAKASLASHGDDLQYGCEVGRLAVRSGRLKDAAEVYDQILQRHPDSTEALNGMGVVLAQLGDLKGAADAFRKALIQRPQDMPASHNLALVMALTGQADAAAPAPVMARTGQADMAVLKPAPVMAQAGRPDTAVPKPAPVMAQTGQVDTAAPKRDDENRPEEQPRAEAAPGSERVVLRARARAWMQVREASGRILLERELRSGETWPVPNKPGLVLSTGNAGGTEIIFDGVAIAPLGGLAEVRHNITLDPDAIKDGKLPPELRSARVAVSPAQNEGAPPPR